MCSLSVMGKKSSRLVTLESTHWPKPSFRYAFVQTIFSFQKPMCSLSLSLARSLDLFFHFNGSIFGWERERERERERDREEESQRLLQYDKMAWLFLQYLALYNNERFPNNIKKLPKWGSQFCQTLNKPSKSCQRLKKFRQGGKILPNLVTLVCSASSVTRCLDYFQ